MYIKDSIHLDANEVEFFNLQLSYIQQKMWEVKHKPMKAFTLIPVNAQAPKGAKEVRYRMYDGAGQAKIIQDYADDLPEVDVYGKEYIAPFKLLGTRYSFSIEDIKTAAMTGINLETAKAVKARRILEELIDTIAWMGDADSGLLGLINYPGILEYIVPADGTGGTDALKRLWSNKTADQMVRDVVGLVSTPMVTTNGVEEPDTVILPLQQYTYAASTRLPYGGDLTVLEFLKKVLPQVKKWDFVNELKGAGASSTDRMMAYVRDPEHLDFQLPNPFEQRPPEARNLTFRVNCVAKCGGVIVYYPQSVAFGDGI